MNRTMSMIALVCACLAIILGVIYKVQLDRTNARLEQGRAKAEAEAMNETFARFGAAANLPAQDTTPAVTLPQLQSLPQVDVLGRSRKPQDAPASPRKTTPPQGHAASAR